MTERDPGFESYLHSHTVTTDNKDDASLTASEPNSVFSLLSEVSIPGVISAEFAILCEANAKVIHCFRSDDEDDDEPPATLSPRGGYDRYRPYFLYSMAHTYKCIASCSF
jgi:hypothetical protein